MVYTVSVLRASKSGASTLEKITEILADHYQVWADGRVKFYNIETRILRPNKWTEIASLPPHTWIVQASISNSY
jgi:hypothetical protein